MYKKKEKCLDRLLGLVKRGVNAVVKHVTKRLYELFFEIFNKCLEAERIPKDKRRPYVIPSITPIYKKRYRRNCNKHRCTE